MTNLNTLILSLINTKVTVLTNTFSVIYAYRKHPSHTVKCHQAIIDNGIWNLLRDVENSTPSKTINANET